MGGEERGDEVGKEGWGDWNLPVAAINVELCLRHNISKKIECIQLKTNDCHIIR